MGEILGKNSKTISTRLVRLGIRRTPLESYNIRSKASSKTSIKMWEDSKFREKMLSINPRKNPIIQSKNGKKSRIFENQVAKDLEKDYDYLFMPQSICDRIGIKNGKIFFIEIKHNGEVLRPKQDQFSKLVKNYIVISK